MLSDRLVCCRINEVESVFCWQAIGHMEAGTKTGMRLSARFFCAGRRGQTNFISLSVSAVVRCPNSTGSCFLKKVCPVRRSELSDAVLAIGPRRPPFRERTPLRHEAKVVSVGSCPGLETTDPAGHTPFVKPGTHFRAFCSKSISAAQVLLHFVFRVALVATE